MGNNRLAAFATAAAVSLGFWAPTPAAALDFRCIEASKYKYLYQLFDNDRQRAAKHFGVTPSELPSDETCRAVLVSGSFVSNESAKKAGSASDYVKLVHAVQRSNGWLAVLYLSSSGGERQSGMLVARLTRLFWLKTVAVTETEFNYVPDIGTMPLSTPDGDEKMIHTGAPLSGFESGWAKYIKTAPIKVRVKSERRQDTCASACTFVHSAGIDRRGLMFVHRGRNSSLVQVRNGDAEAARKVSMADTIPDMQQSDAPVIRLYREMDAGEKVIQLRNDTSTWTTAAIAPARFSRYVDDILQAKCGGDAVDLERREIRARALLAKAGSNQERVEGILKATQTRRAKVEPCIAAAHEIERRKQFAKYCANGSCDVKTMATALASNSAAARAGSR